MIEENGEVTYWCRSCGGNGWLDLNILPVARIVCPTCGGSGKLKPCRDCMGRGSFPYRAGT